MKRLFFFALTLAAVPTFRAIAAPPPATEPTSAPTSVATKVDPAANALFADSAKAYGALKGLSMTFAYSAKNGTANKHATGTIAFSRPNLVKIIVKDGANTSLTLMDGKNLYAQVYPKLFQGNPISPNSEGGIEMAMGSLPAGLDTFLPSLIGGKNPLEADSMYSAFARVIPNNGVRVGYPTVPGEPVGAFNLYFDPTDKLLRRVEVTIDFKGRHIRNVTALSNVKLNPTFAPAEFRFQPRPGVKVVAEVPEYDPRLKVGAFPFPLQGKDLNGKTHSWSEFKGKVVLLDFWATWCGPCVGEFPNVLKNYAKYHRKGFEMLGVSLDEDQQALTSFIKNHHLTYPNLFDAKGWKNLDAMTYGVQAIPFTLLIGKDGKIAAVEPSDELLEPAIKAALAKGKSHRRH